MGHPDEDEWRQEAAMMEWFEDQLRQQSHEPVFAYLAKYGDSIQERVDACRQEAIALRTAGFHGASLVRAAAGIEVSIRFFLARPLVLSAFLSDEWAHVLTSRILHGRTAEDRELLPAILRNWGIDVTTILLSSGDQLWETIVGRVWSRRNAYVHAGGSAADADSALAIECLDGLLARVVAPIAKVLEFTREETGRWSIVLSSHDRTLNPPRHYDTASPF